MVQYSTKPSPAYQISDSWGPAWLKCRGSSQLTECGYKGASVKDKQKPWCFPWIINYPNEMSILLLVWCDLYRWLPIYRGLTLWWRENNVHSAESALWILFSSWVLLRDRTAAVSHGSQSTRQSTLRGSTNIYNAWSTRWGKLTYHGHYQPTVLAI